MTDIGGFWPIDMSGGMAGLKDKASIVKSTVLAMILLLSVPVALYIVIEGLGVLEPIIPSGAMPLLLVAVVAVLAYGGFRGFTRYRTWRRRS